jgi:glucokinase
MVGVEPLRFAPLIAGCGHLLRLLRTQGPRTISELAALVEVSRSTIIQRLEFLLDAKLVIGNVAPANGRGRPAEVFHFNPAAGLVLAVQVGLSGCRVAVTDLKGGVLADDFVLVDFARGPTVLLESLIKSFDAMVASLPIGRHEIVGVGVGMPSAVELQNYARSLGLGALGWDRDRFRIVLRDHYSAPVFLDLDVNLLARAEWGASWSSVEVCVCVKLGTLIHAAILVNGEPVRGAGGLAGELGHIKVSGASTVCSCGGIGCLNSVASGDALVRELRASGVDVTHVSEVVTLANRGDPVAVQAVREAGRRIGEALSSVVNLLNPSVIVAWGYLVDQETSLFAGIREGLYQNALPGSGNDVRLVTAALGVLAGAKGAARLVLHEVLGDEAVDRMLLTKSWLAAAPAPDGVSS